MPDRLKRLDLIHQWSPIYFVTVCTAHRQKLLATEAIQKALNSFAERGPNYGAWIGAYVLMPDHLHLFAAIDDERINLARWMKALKGTLSSELRSAGYAPPYWQKGFFDHVLRSGESYSEKWIYVRDNPVRTGLAKDWEEWPYRGEIFDLQFHDARF